MDQEGIEKYIVRGGRLLSCNRGEGISLSDNPETQEALSSMARDYHHFREQEELKHANTIESLRNLHID